MPTWLNRHQEPEEVKTLREKRLEILLIEQVNELLGSVYVHDQRWVSATLTELGYSEDQIQRIWIGEDVLTINDED